jgi:hypothetical protein
LEGGEVIVIIEEERIKLGRFLLAECKQFQPSGDEIREWIRIEQEKGRSEE